MIVNISDNLLTGINQAKTAFRARLFFRLSIFSVTVAVILLIAPIFSQTQFSTNIMSAELNLTIICILLLSGIFCLNKGTMLSNDAVHLGSTIDSYLYEDLKFHAKDNFSEDNQKLFKTRVLQTDGLLTFEDLYHLFSLR